MRSRTGKQSEDIVEVVCSNMFFSDFVVRNPAYTKPSGKRIELADLLIPFGNSLLTFQVKSKDQGAMPIKKSAIELQRLTNTIDDAVGQVKTIKRGLEHNWLRGLETARGFKMDVDPSDISYIGGVVILDLIGEESLPQKEQSQLFGGFTMRKGLPIHVFLATEFYQISRELDTLPDFMGFLKLTQDLYEEEISLIAPSTLDLLAFYKMDPDALENAISSKTRIFIEEGMWEAYRTHHADLIAERNRLNQPSYLIDGIIDYLHSSVGYEQLLMDNQLARLSGQGEVEGYLALAREIASLSRLERRTLGERLKRCLNRAMQRKEAFSAIILQEKKTAYLVYSKSGERAQRQERLQLLTAMLYCHLDLEKVIGIATEPLSGEGRSFDVIGYSGVVFENAEGLAKQAKRFFGEAYRATGYEYGVSDDPDA